MFCKKDFLKNFAKIHRKTSASKSFFYKAAGLFYRTTPLAASVDRNAKSNFKDFLHITLKKVFWEKFSVSYGIGNKNATTPSYLVISNSPEI